MARRSSPDRAVGAATQPKRENANQDRRPSPVFNLIITNGQIHEGWTASGMSVRLFQDSYVHPLTGKPAYYRDFVQIITIAQPCSRYGAPRVRFNRCVDEHAVIVETLAATGFDYKKSLWVTHERADCSGLIAFLKKLQDGWRFPMPVMLQLPDPKVGEVLTAVRPDGAVLQAYADRSTRRIVVVTRQVGKDGQLEAAVCVDVGNTPQYRCPDRDGIDGSFLKAFAWTRRFDPAELRCTITDGKAAKPILDWLHTIAERHAEAKREGMLQGRREK